MNLPEAHRPTGSPATRWVRTNHGTWRGWVRHLLGWLTLCSGRLRPFIGHDVASPQRLVFVCLGNINRSAFACAVARQLGEAAVSIGLSATTGAPATPNARTQARAQGYDLDSHRATDLGHYAYQEGDLLLVMELRHAHVLLAQGIPSQAIAMLGWWSSPLRIHLHDPHTLSADYFATCFTLIESAVRRLLQTRRGSGP